MCTGVLCPQEENFRAEKSRRRGHTVQRRLRLLSVVGEEVGSDAGRTEGITCECSLNSISLLYGQRPVVFTGPPLTLVQIQM